MPRASETIDSLRMTVYASLMAALTAAGSYLVLPIGPVPIVLQSLFIYLAGLLLGPRWGAASVAVYLLAGVLGLPVFAGGIGGIGRLVGPTGGYLVGYLPGVWLIGLISARFRATVAADVAAMVAGTALIYACGAGWLKVVTGMDAGAALAVGVVPFLPGDVLKVIAAATLARGLRPMIGLDKAAGAAMKRNSEHH